MIHRIYLALSFLLLSLPLLAENVLLNTDHPQRYEVVKGDTLWDIAGKFLENPWQWTSIWQVNPQIENPDLIYPGDILSLVYRNGHPVLEVTRGQRTYKLSPEVREVMLEQAIPTVPLEAIRPFLTRPRVVDEEALLAAPYVVAGSNERLISGAGDTVYVRGLDPEKGNHYSLFYKGAIYHDPETEELLGYEALYLGDAWVKEMGDPATVTVRSAKHEIKIGDRLLPVIEDDFEMNFIPRPPDQPLKGQIISVLGSVSQVGQYQVVVVNLGERDNVEAGYVLSIFQVGDTVRDVVAEDPKAMVTLPDEYAGVGMVFKTFNKASLVLIMKAHKAIHINDRVRSPEQSDFDRRIDAKMKHFPPSR